jgi:class 3 adenylate cyclase/tetratricopeptide (TPR) repeat protein
VQASSGASPEADQEERRVVTILFADLAGSTALGERLDPEDMRVLQGELFGLVNGEVERYGGTTEKFIGDAIVAVFGVPLTHEDDAERAVRAALAVRDAFPRFAARVRAEHGTEVGLRIGVNTGEVISGRDAVARGELMVTGDAVNVAARLQQLAEPGAVLVGDRTRLSTHRAIVYGDRADLEAKGKRAPVGAWQALRVAERQVGTARAGPAPLIGRDDELALLRLTAARVERERTPQLVTVFGQAGVGKSRLLSEFVEELEGARTAVGRCVPYGDGITYLPLAEAASSLAGIRDDDPLEIARAKLRASVERTVAPEHVDRVVDPLAWTLGLSLPGSSTGISDAGDVRWAVQKAWTVYLQALGCHQPFVLVIEDIHWASEPLLDLLEEVAGALEDTAVLILCPSRPELVETRPSWGTGRLRSSSLTLSPLGSDAAEALLLALVGADGVPGHIARAILERAEGNPFFVEEMLAMLVERGVLEKGDGGWTTAQPLGPVQVPDSIHGVIAARIDLLDPPDRDALRRCSVMGRVFWPSAVGVDDDVIAGLGRRGIAIEHPESSFSGLREFTFKHALTQDVAYATLPRVERRALHCRVADWIVDSIPDRQAEKMELVAYHWEQALQYGDPDRELERRAFDALLSAGEAAVRRGAYSSAAGLLTRALEVAPDELERCRALLLAARVDIARAEFARSAERLEEVIAAAERHGDRTLLADAFSWRGRAAWLRGEWREALASAEAAVTALAGLAESSELARALARLSQIQMLRSLPESEASAEHALEVARRVGEPEAEANARINLFTARSSRGEMPDASEVRAIIDIAVAAGAHDEGARAVINHLWSASLLGDLRPVESFVDEWAPRLTAGFAAESFGQYLTLSRAALIYVPAGRWGEADAVLEGVGALGSMSSRLVWLWLFTGLALRRGDLESVDRHLPDFRETATASQEPQRILPMASIAMPRALLAGDHDTVRALGDLVVAQPLHGVTMSAATIPICRTLLTIGDRDRLAQFVAALAKADSTSQVGMLGVGGSLLAHVDGDVAGASRDLLGAEQGLRDLGRHYDAACVALDAARALEAAGDGAEADRARARATSFLEPLGCVNPV